MKHCVGGDVCYQDEDMYKKENRQKISAPALLENLTDDANAKLYVAKFRFLTISLYLTKHYLRHLKLCYSVINHIQRNPPKLVQCTHIILSCIALRKI